MKRSHQRSEPKNLILESALPDDATLPLPRGRAHRTKKPSICELAHLRATRAFGGLLPEQTGTQFWQCSHCGTIHPSREAAKACHESASANRIQTCSGCGQRLTSCVCQKRF